MYRQTLALSLVQHGQDRPPATKVARTCTGRLLLVEHVQQPQTTGQHSVMANNKHV